MKWTSFILFSEPSDEIFSPQNLLLTKIYCKNLKPEMGPPPPQNPSSLRRCKPWSKSHEEGGPFFLVVYDT